MATSTPDEQLLGDISSLQSKINSLEDAVRLNQVRKDTEDLNTQINNLGQRVSKMRERGYAFEKELEGQASSFLQQWNSLYPNITSQINQQSAGLQSSIQPLEAQINQITAQQGNVGLVRPMVESLKSSLPMLEEKASAADQQIRGMYQSLENQITPVKTHLDDLDWMLDQLSEAAFKLLPSESGIMAVKAIWYKEMKHNDDDPEGIFYLTDQRILFEQKQEVATKKVLFVATEKQKIQELKWEIPVALIGDVKPSKQGMLKNEDHLDLNFDSGAPIQSAHLHIWQDGTRWVQYLNRAKTKGYDQGRAIAIDQTLVDKFKSLPSQCPSCGGALNQVVLRGQDNVKCEFCGFVIRL